MDAIQGIGGGILRGAGMPVSLIRVPNRKTLA